MNQDKGDAAIQSSAASQKMTDAPHGRVQRLPLGKADYRSICDGNYYYVDKTLLIKEIVDRGSEVTLFTRPRRFGKSLSLSMLKTFFAVSEEDTARYFRNRKIWKRGPEYTDLQGRYPVIHLSFKKMKGATWDKLYVKMRDELRYMYTTLCEGVDTAHLPQSLQDQVLLFTKGDPGEEKMEDSLRSLARVLHAYHKVPPVILIDEYDVPLESAWARGFYDEAVDFTRELLSNALKDSDDLAFSCLTGVLPVAQASVFSDLNNLDTNGVLSAEYEECFGFTPDEVREMAAAYGVLDKYPEIEEWYEGYRFGDQEVFNPWSVISYIRKRCVARPYWTSTSAYRPMARVLELANASILNDLATLLDGGTIWTEVNEGLAYPAIGNPAGGDQRVALWSLLLMSGYLTTVPGDPANPARSPSGNASELELMIPNQEIRNVARTEVLDRMLSTGGVAPQKDLWDALVAGDCDKVKEILREVLAHASCHDFRAENSYQMMLFGLLFEKHGYRTLSNQETGRGRADLAYLPPSGRLPGIVMEFKFEKDDPDEEDEARQRRLRRLALEGLEQARKRDYRARMRLEGVKDALVYGVGCTGKDVTLILEGKRPDS